MPDSSATDQQIELQVEAMISQLVDRFYSRVGDDAEIGPIFNNAIGNGWPEHLQRMKDFWSSIMLGTGRFKGSPMMAHLGLPVKINATHFQRWLSLWRLTAPEICPPELAAIFITKAEMMAERLLSGVEMHYDSVHAAGPA